MFRDAVREFAETEVGPLVQTMDEAAQFEPSLIPKFFELGLMGIEVPEQFGGAAARIFMAVLAIEELARVDASAAIYVDVHNTLVNNALLRWASTEQQDALLPPAHLRPARAPLRSPSPAAAATPSLSPPRPSGRATTGSSPAGSSGSPTAPRRERSSSSPTPTSPRATRGSPASSWSGASPDSRSARRRTSSASGPRAPPS